MTDLSPILPLLACPVLLEPGATCAGGLVPLSAEVLNCLKCGASYKVEAGIPVLIPPLGASSSAAQWQQQRAYFDESVNPEFEIERPESGGRFYDYLLTTKFIRALKSPPLKSSYDRVLDACCGSGVLCEALSARTRCLLVGLDFSLGAVRRARERARRRGYLFFGVVGDATSPPFARQSFDLVTVHDALHHLQDPLNSLVTLAGLTREAIVAIEPAVSWVTRAAVCAGLSVDVEAAGNPVRRVRGRELEGAIRSAGFRTAMVRRYLMYYPHEPGWAFRLFDLRPLYDLGRLGVALGRFLGPLGGNKVQIVAMR